MNVAKIYREQHGLTLQQMAELLSKRLGRPITAHGVNTVENKQKAPGSWNRALASEIVADAPDLSADSQPLYVDDVIGSEGTNTTESLYSQPRRSDYDDWRSPAPEPHGGTRPGGSLARERIAQTYNFMGAGLAMMSQNPGVGAVFETYADTIAAAWVEAARENKVAERFVKIMESGGATSQLIICHGFLLIGVVYVTGRAPGASAILPAAFRGFHDTAARERAAADAEREAAGETASAGGVWPGANGAAGQSAADPLADTSG